MSDNKTIQDALAEIQRKVNEERARKISDMYASLDEAMPEVTVGGKKVGTTAKTVKNKIDQYNVNAGRTTAIPPSGNQNLPGPPPQKPPSASVTNIKGGPTSTASPKGGTVKPSTGGTWGPQKVKSTKSFSAVTTPTTTPSTPSSTTSTATPKVTAPSSTAAPVSKLGKAAGAAGSVLSKVAPPLQFGLDYSARKDAGQSTGRALGGAAASTGGMMAGGITGAEIGGAVGGPVGAVLGGIGGSLVGAEGLSKAYDWVADKFSGKKPAETPKTTEAPKPAETPKAETPKAQPAPSTSAPATPKPAETPKAAEKTVSTVKTKGGDFPVFQKGGEASQSFQSAYKAATPGSEFKWKAPSETGPERTYKAAELPKTSSTTSKTETESGKRKKMSEENINELSPFERTFAQKMKQLGPGKTYRDPHSGKDILLKYADNKPHAGGSAKPHGSAPLPPRRPDEYKSNIAPAPKETTWRDPAKIDYSKNNLGKPETLPSTVRGSAADPARDAARDTGITGKPGGETGVTSRDGSVHALQGKNVTVPTMNRTPEYESGGKKKKMSEDTNPLIAAFLKLQSENPQNMFEAAKKAKKDYDKDGKIESPKDEVWGSRFRAAKAAGKMEEGKEETAVWPEKTVHKTKPGVYMSSTRILPKDRAAYEKDVFEKGAKAAKVLSGKKMEEATLDPKDSDATPASKTITKTAPKEDPSTPKSYPGAASTVNGPNPTSDVMKKIAKEEVEVTFSEAELEHFNRFFNEAPVAPSRPEVARGADSVSDKMSQNDVTGTSTEGGKKKVKEEVELDEKLTDEAKANIRTALSDKMKKTSGPARSLIKLAKMNPANVKEETLEEGDLSVGGLYDRLVDHLNGENPSRQKAAAVEKAITKVHGEKVMGHLRKAVNANRAGNFDGEMVHIDNARTAAGKSDRIGSTVGSGRSEFRRTHEEVELEEGRPKKNPTPETTERDPRKHIQVEAGRAAAGNVIDFPHNDGTKSKITPAMGRRIVAHLQGLKPADRQAAVNKMHDSAEGLKV